ncbi:MAG: pyridoxamine 5'-phosphate oxidase family protein [Alphaproteobacteria bacterium]|nr:pyridoxamine 5'-phosphate oxidase family protein [Alphaproteobacteria bacterium]
MTTETSTNSPLGTSGGADDARGVLGPTDRTRLRRLNQRGRYDRAAIDAVLDGTLMCSVGYILDGKPYVTPTAHWREGDHVYWHGSSASRMLKFLRTGPEICFNAAAMDGLVLARSGMHSSINYRSVTLYGQVEIVEGRDQKLASLEAFVEKITPGRWAQLRFPTDQELKATTVCRLPITEGAAKIRTGPPHDDAEDMDLDVWAGVLHYRTVFDGLEADPDLKAGVEPDPALELAPTWPEPWQDTVKRAGAAD